MKQSTLRRVLAHGFGLILCLIPCLAMSAEIPKVKPSLIKVSLIPDKPAIMLGEPTFLSFLVENRSEKHLRVIVGGDYRNSLGRPESFTVTVMGDDGKKITQPDSGGNFGGFEGPQELPAKGSYTFRLFLPAWADFKKPGKYSIVAERLLKIVDSKTIDWSDETGTLDLEVNASTEIQVTPLDDHKMGELIAAKGEAMLNETPQESESAEAILSSIQDVRVIPYFIRALKTRRYDRKFSALQALSKFDDEGAFDALKLGMETSGNDIGDTTTPELARSSAAGIRHAAAGALARSPHPDALSFLLKQRNDESPAVRNTILHALGRMPPEDAVSILREMSQDEDVGVRNEAKRYLKLQLDKKKVATPRQPAD